MKAASFGYFLESHISMNSCPHEIKCDFFLLIRYANLIIMPAKET